VAHYREGSSQLGDERIRQRIAAWGPDAVAIIPIPAATQHGWMLDYLRSLSLSPEERAALERLLSTSYTSRLNLLFSRALGTNGDGWRASRLRKVNESAEAWARENGVPFERLAEGRTTARIEINAPSPGYRFGHGSEVRERLHALVDSMSDDEVEHVLVPLATVARLIDRTARS
jgi:hypothetical protein